MLRIPAFICKCSLPCILLITALLMFVHQQPDQLSDLQDFLLPPADCAVPCFLGIRPGVTSLVAAIEALRALGAKVVSMPFSRALLDALA